MVEALSCGDEDARGAGRFPYPTDSRRRLSVPTKVKNLEYSELVELLTTILFILPCTLCLSTFRQVPSWRLLHRRPPEWTSILETMPV